jgi:hypothetical protein
VSAVDGADNGLERDRLQPNVSPVRPSAATTSSNGSMTVTSSRRRTRDASFVRACLRRSRANAADASE